jgi:hypothetical protein
MELSYPNPTTNWVADSGASSHNTPYPGNIHSSCPPPSAHPLSIIVGNGSVLPVTSVGYSVLPGPCYLNEILVTPNLVQNNFFRSLIYLPLTTPALWNLTYLVYL